MGSQRVGHDWATFTFTFRTRKTKIIYQQQLCPPKSKRNQFKQKGNDPSRKFISWEIKSKRKSRYPRKCKKTVFTFLDSLKYVWFLKAKFIPLSDGICHTCRCEIYIYAYIYICKYTPTSVFLPGTSHGQRSLAGHGPQGCKESGMTEHIYTYDNYNKDQWVRINEPMWFKNFLIFLK